MSKYEKLWEYIKNNIDEKLVLSFDEISDIGPSIDHSFLNCKKELEEYGIEVGKISMKQQTVVFQRREQK